MKHAFTVEYGSIQASYWGYYGIVSSFGSVFLLGKGFDNYEIGILFALGAVFGALIQPFLANVADNSSRFHLHRLLELLVLVMIVFAASLFAFPTKSLALFFVFMMLDVIHLALQGLINSIPFRLERGNIYVNFGLCRAVGSIGFSVAVLFIGQMVEQFGNMAIQVIGLGILIVFMGTLVINDFHFLKARRSLEKEQRRAAETDTQEAIGLVDFLKRNKFFLLISIGVIGIYFANTLQNVFLYQVVSDVGGTTSDMGNIAAIMAFLEVPTMVAFNFIKRRFKVTTLLKVACIGFILKILVIWLAPNVTFMYAVQVVQMFAFALFLPAMVYYIGQIMDRGEAVKGQAWFVMSTTIATVLASYFGGLILDLSGAKMLCFVGLILTVAGSAIIIPLVDKAGTKKLAN